MRIKLDENLPARLRPVLSERGHDVDTVVQQGLAGRTDAEVWQAAQRDERFLITQDLDFSDIRRYAPGSHHGLLLVRLSEPGREALLHHVRLLFARQDVESWRGAFVVSTERKIRIRLPQPP